MILFFAVLCAFCFGLTLGAVMARLFGEPPRETLVAFSFGSVVATVSLVVAAVIA